MEEAASDERATLDLGTNDARCTENERGDESKRVYYHCVDAHMVRMVSL